MLTISYIVGEAAKLADKYGTRDPFKICDELGVRVRIDDLGTAVKAYYFYQSRIRNIVINSRISEPVRRVLAAHELGHDRLHRDMATLKGFQEFSLFDKTKPAEYQANIFAAELLIDDDELLDLLADADATFYTAARELYVPAALLDFKMRVLKHKGYSIEAPYIANGDFLKNDIDGCFESDQY